MGLFLSVLIPKNIYLSEQRIMKSIVYLGIIGLVGSVIEAQPLGPFVAILRQEDTPNFGGIWSHEFEADNGIPVMRGFYSYPMDDGSVATFTWVADSNGYRVESPLLPISPVNPHPIPPHSQQQINFANEQQSRGLYWDDTVFAWV